VKVAATALTILDEVCDDKMYLESLVATKSALFSHPGREALDRLGDRGRLLLTRSVILETLVRLAFVFLLSEPGF
jgi:hypothetical protein